MDTEVRSAAGVSPPPLHAVPRAAERLGFRTHVEEVGLWEWFPTFWK